MNQLSDSDKGEPLDIMKNLERCLLHKEKNCEKQVQSMEDGKILQRTGNWKKRGEYGKDSQEIIENYRSLVGIQKKTFISQNYWLCMRKSITTQTTLNF